MIGSWVQTKEEQKKIKNIEKNLDTQAKWLKSDYVDFYNRDVRFLLKLVRGE